MKKAAVFLVLLICLFLASQSFAFAADKTGVGSAAYSAPTRAALQRGIQAPAQRGIQAPVFRGMQAAAARSIQAAPHRGIQASAQRGAQAAPYRGVQAAAVTDKRTGAAVYSVDRKASQKAIVESVTAERTQAKATLQKRFTDMKADKARRIQEFKTAVSTDRSKAQARWQGAYDRIRAERAKVKSTGSANTIDRKVIFPIVNGETR